MNIIKSVLLLFFGVSLSMQSIAQSINTSFGKNRVQYHDDFNKWWRYETENYITHWYGKGRNIAEGVVQIAEMDHDDIQNIMEHRFNEKIEIIVYTDLTDLKQSNIGIEETFVNELHETKVEENTMFVYYNGDHQHLRKQIRQGIATIYINSILLGTNLQEMVQNAVLLNLPKWYKKGLISYVTDTWNTELDDELRDIVYQDEKYWNFEKISKKFPKIAGHSFWYFLEQYYGKSSITNVIYLTRINRNLPSSFIYVLSVPFEELAEQWEAFYKQIYQNEASVFDELRDKRIGLNNKDHQVISQLRISPDGEKLVYCVNDQGKYKVVLRDLKDDSEKTIFKYGFKNVIQETDYNYPLISWRQTGTELSIVYEHRDVIKLRKYFPSSNESEEQIIPEGIQRIYSISYIDELDYVFSASVKGFADLIMYKSKTRQYENLTSDYFDDLGAEYINYEGRDGVLFTSNRFDNINEKRKRDTILPLDYHDVFFLPIEDKNKVERLTFTPKEDERFPFMISDNKICFVSDKSGVKNRKIKNLRDEKNGYINSNFPRNIIRHHAIQNSNLYVYTAYLDGAYQTFLDFIETDKKAAHFKTHFNRLNGQLNLKGTQNFVEASKQEMLEDYLFITKYADPQKIESIENELISSPEYNYSPLDFSKEEYRDVLRFNSARAVASRLSYKVVDFSSKLDNSVLFEGLESYTDANNELNNQALGLLIKGTLKDLFEDYDIEVGARYPTSFNGSEYFLSFNNKKSLIDRKYSLYRKSYTRSLFENEFPVQKVKSEVLVSFAQFKYPLDIYRSFRLTTSLRFDKFYYLSTEVSSLNEAIINDKRLGVKLEYIYDNTIGIDINIKNGSRYKFYTEIVNKFKLDVVDGFAFDGSTGFTNIVGADIRHYVPVTRYGVLALRLSGATSFGSEKMIYYLGGMENWLFSSFNNSTPIPEDIAFSYKANAPQMRGFRNNIRNGSSFLLANAELRLPIVRWLFPNFQHSFFKNLQFTGFMDVGTAWHGLSPYNDDNPVNAITLERPPVITVNANYFRDPLVMGVGTGVRSYLFGYYLKFDYAWGIETKKVLSPRFYFSLGYDF